MTPQNQSDPKALFGDRFKGARAVVIGGRGAVGAAVVDQLIELGAQVVIGSHSSGAVESARQDFEAGKPATLPIDLRDNDSITQFAEDVTDFMPSIDILVMSAGRSVQVPLKKIDQLTDDLIDEIFASAATGVLKLVRSLTPNLKVGEQPVIVFVGSVAAKTGGGSNLAYSAAKGALDTMTIGLAKALAPEIRVLTISPSALDTPFVAARNQDFIDATVKATPLGRLADVEEVATSILSAARVLTASTGISIPVDGGRHL